MERRLSNFYNMKVKEKDREYAYIARRAKEWSALKKNIEGGQ
jgi:hypothetical protein